MTTVNHYFQSGKSVGFASEQNLYEDLIIESMKIYGLEVYYIPRKSFNQDNILTEDPLNTYEHAYPIEMYMENVGGFEGDGELLTKFGIEVRDTANFIVARRRWQQAIGDTGNSILQRPAEGDIIYFPLNKGYFEIRKVEGNKPFYQLGKLYIFRMYCELMQFSNERFSTGIDEIDRTLDVLNQTIDNFEVLLETGDSLLVETNALSPLVLEEYESLNEITDTENELFSLQIDNILDFSEKNPFGEPSR